MKHKNKEAVSDVESTHSFQSEIRSPRKRPSRLESDNDQSEDESTRKKSKRKSSPVNTGNVFEDFRQNNHNLRPISIEEEFSEDDEVYLLNVPSTLDPNLLLDQSISLEGKSKLKINRRRYTSNILSSDEPMLILTKQLYQLTPAGIINICERSKVSQEIVVPTVEDDSKQELPSGMKVKHPFFGTDYKEKINLNKDVLKKLEESVERETPTTKHKKKKHRHQEEIVIEDHIENDTGKKKKKRIKVELQDQRDNSSFDVFVQIAGEKENVEVVKKKHKMNGTTSTPIDNKKKKKNRDETSESGISSVEELVTSPQKKKIKKETKQNLIFNLLNTVKSELSFIDK